MKHATDDPGLRHILTDLTFHILIALGNGPAHGYANGKDVKQQSGGRLDPKHRHAVPGSAPPARR